jgi:hypothetical protein
MTDKNDGRLKTYQVSITGIAPLLFVVDVQADCGSDAIARLKRLLGDYPRATADDGDELMQIIMNNCSGLDPRIDPHEFHIDDVDIYDEGSIEEASWPPNMLPSHLK